MPGIFFLVIEATKKKRRKINYVQYSAKQVYIPQHTCLCQVSFGKMLSFYKDTDIKNREIKLYIYKEENIFLALK